jgi:hypothetical protein
VSEPVGIDVGARFARRDDVEWIELDHEVVVHDRGSEQLHLLNVSAAAVWLRCDGTSTASDVVRDLRERYTHVPASFESDVLHILGRLRDARLVEER